MKQWLRVTDAQRRPSMPVKNQMLRQNIPPRRTGPATRCPPPRDTEIRQVSTRFLPPPRHFSAVTPPSGAAGGGVWPFVSASASRTHRRRALSRVTTNDTGPDTAAPTQSEYGTEPRQPSRAHRQEWACEVSDAECL